MREFVPWRSVPAPSDQAPDLAQRSARTVPFVVCVAQFLESIGRARCSTRSAQVVTLRVSRRYSWVPEEAPFY
jgi:hypothetical protein